MLYLFYQVIEILKKNIPRKPIFSSPPLVVAYSLAGSMLVDLYNDPLGKDENGKEVYLKDIWPSNKEIEEVLLKSLNPEMFRERYSNVSKGPAMATN